MKHWYVPGVYTYKPETLPIAKNLSRNIENIFGTSLRDPIAFSYSNIKSLFDSNGGLQEFFYTHAYRIVFSRLEKSSITESLRTLVFQIEFEKDRRALVSIFLNFLKEIQKTPLEFQPLFSQLVEDKDIFTDDEEIRVLNKNFVRVL